LDERTDMAQALEVLKIRRSVRAFSDKALAPELIENIVDSARFAATARNEQPWEFVAICDQKVLMAIAGLADNGKFIAQAKACIAVFCRDTKYYLEDGCAATENILLAATALGVGSCWVAGDKKPYSSNVSVLLKAPASLKLVSLVALGWPKEKDGFSPAEKRPLKDVLHWEGF
jgi:nitroreductase